MKTRLLVLSFAALCLTAVPAIAGPTFGDGGVALQGVLNNITLAPNAGVSSVNVTTDYIPDSGDSLWSVTGTGGSTSTMIIELAAFATTNKFGVYDAANPANKVQLFAGANVAGDQAQLSIKADGSVWMNFADTGIDFAAGNLFGFYLDASAGNVDPQSIWYSNSTLNVDGQFDHMAAYQGKDIDTVQLPTLAPGLWTSREYVLAFEDLRTAPIPPYGSDKDYTDFVVMIESVNPVPVPAAVLLGLLGLSAAGLKLRRFA